MEASIPPASGRNNVLYINDPWGVAITPSKETSIRIDIEMKDKKKNPYTYSVMFDDVKGGRETFLPVFGGGKGSKPYGRFVITRVTITAVYADGTPAPDSEPITLDTESYVRGTNRALKTELVPVGGPKVNQNPDTNPPEKKKRRAAP
jgi:hypothetical protein